MTAAGVIQPSASIASTGKSIRYIGNHIYCFSGEFIMTQTEQTLFDFSTGTGYIVADLVACGAVNQGNGAGGITTWQLSFNGQVVINLKTETYADRAPAFGFTPIIIPPLTEVKLTADSSTTDAGFLITSSIVGRVYGAE